MSKRPTFSDVKTKGRAAVADAYADAAEAKAAPKKTPKWQVGARSTSVWMDDRHLLKLREIGLKTRKPMRVLVFDAVNMLLLAHDELPIERDFTKDDE